MTKRNSASILSLALAAAFAAPAFAQSATDAQSQEAPPATQEQAPPTQTASDASASAPETSSDKKSWSDLDADKNGTLNASEASAMDSLAKIFPQADADGDGALAPDEYKAWLSTNGKQETPEAQK